jgi:hypothetical protein
MPQQSNGRWDESPELNTIAGTIPYLTALQIIHEMGKPRSYLEIGVRNGASLSLAHCPSVGVDPDPSILALQRGDRRLFAKTSDAFFREDASTVLREKPDLVFIDGMHLFEFALRDFMNVERHAHPASVIILDDIYPNHPDQALRVRRTRVWTGDVWKMEYCLGKYRADLRLQRLDVSPAGLLVVSGLDPTNRRLWESYDSIVQTYNNPESLYVPERVLMREGAFDPTTISFSESIIETTQSWRVGPA